MRTCCGRNLAAARTLAALSCLAAICAGVQAADLVVDAGQTQTVSTSATYDTITVNGALTVDSGATLAATMVYVGHDGANGLVTVTGGAKFSLPNTANQGMFLGSITAGSSTTPGQGRLVIENGSVEGRLYFSQNCISNGTTKTTSPTNELWLGEGGVYKGAITHFGDPSLRIAFAGGHAIDPSGNSLLNVKNPSDTYVDSIDGNPIRIDCNNVHFTFPNFGNNPNIQTLARVYFRGSGDFIREGQPKAVANPLHMSGYTGPNLTDWSQFTGRIVADGGGIRYFLNNQVDTTSEDSARQWVARNGGFFSFDCVSHNLSSFTGGGFLTNHTGSAGTLRAHVADSQTWDLRTPLVNIHKFKGGSLTVGDAVPKSVAVHDGTFTLAGRESNNWKFYRFKVDAIKDYDQWSDGHVQIDEFKLLDGDVDVTRPYAMVKGSSNGTTAGSVTMAVDGIIDNNHKWCYKSSTFDDYWFYVGYDQPIHVTRYQWYSGGDAIMGKDENNNPTNTFREPIAWRVQGSMDGATWNDLDVQTDFTPNPARNALSADFQIANDSHVDCPGNVPVDVMVCTGATFVVGENRDAKFSPLLNFGTVNYGAGSDFVCGTDGKKAVYLNPAYAGTGDFVKEGSATSFVYGVSALTGAVRVTSGTLSVTGFGCPLKYWRFTAKNIVTGLDGLFQLSEIDLRAADGTRVNANLTVPTVAVASASSLAAGTAAFVQGHGYRSNDNEGLPKMFDGNWATKCCVVHPTSSSSERIQPKLANPDSWVMVVFRLADDAKPPVCYYLVSGTDAKGLRNPNYWALEASADGVNWITVDAPSGVSTPMANSAIFNGGDQYAISNYAGVAESHFPNASDVIVSPGATLALAPMGSTLSSLTVDCSGGSGTVSGFTPAAGGTLNLVNVDSYRAVRRLAALPITLENPGDMRAISTWTVKVDGEPVPDKVRFSRGALTLKVVGMEIIFR